MMNVTVACCSSETFDSHTLDLTLQTGNNVMMRDVDGARYPNASDIVANIHPTTAKQTFYKSLKQYLNT